MRASVGACMAVLLFIAGCATSARTRDFPASPKGVEAALNVAASQPDGNRSYPKISLQPVPVSAVSRPEVLLGSLDGMERLRTRKWLREECSDLDARCGIPDNVTALYAVTYPNDTTDFAVQSFAPTRNGLSELLEFSQTTPGTRTYANVVQSEDRQLYLNHVHITGLLQFNDTIFCGKFGWFGNRCHLIEEIEFIAIGEQAEKIVRLADFNYDLEQALRFLGNGEKPASNLIFGMASPKAEFARYTLFEAKERNDEQFCGRFYDSQFRSERELCLDIAQIKQITVKDGNRTITEIASDTAKLPLLLLSLGLQPG